MNIPFPLKTLGVLALAGGVVMFIRGGTDFEPDARPPALTAAARVSAAFSEEEEPRASSPLSTAAAPAPDPRLALAERETAGVSPPETSPAEAATFEESPARAATRRWQRAADARRSAERAPAPARFLTPSSPGTSLTVEEQAVTVEATLEVAGSPDPSLSVLIGQPADLANQPEPPDAPVSQAAEPLTSLTGGPAAPGMTYEEQIFRTKWGWAAYDQARRAALAEPQTGEVSP